MVKAFLILALRKYFENDSEHPYTPDRTTSRIFISSSFPIDTVQADIVPAVIVEGSSVNIEAQGIGAGMETMIPKNMYTRIKVNTYIVSSALTVTCVSESPDDAEETAFRLSFWLMAIKEYCREILELQYMSVGPISPPEKFKQNDADGLYRVSIAVPFKMAMNLNIDPEDPGELLRGIDYVITKEILNDLEHYKEDKPSVVVIPPKGGPGSNPGPIPTDPHDPKNPDDPNNPGGKPGTNPNNPSNPGNSDDPRYKEGIYLTFTIQDGKDISGDQSFRISV